MREKAASGKTLWMVGAGLLLAVAVSRGAVDASAGPPTHEAQWATKIRWQEYWSAYSQRTTSDEGHIVAGSTTAIAGRDSDAWYAKLDVNGNVIWQKTYGGSKDDEALSVLQTADGGFLFAGRTESSGAGKSDGWIVKLDSTGAFEWQRTHGGSSDDRLNSVVKTSDGGYISSGWTRSFGAGGADAWCLKLDASGKALWRKTYGGVKDDFALDMGCASDGGFVLAGKTNSSSAGKFDGWLIKLDSTGGMLWERRYGGTQNDAFNGVAAAADGGFAVAGENASNQDAMKRSWFVRVDGSGQVTWEYTRGEYGNAEAGYAIAQAKGGGFICAGQTVGYAYWLKLGPTGDKVWLRLPPRLLPDVPYSIQSASDGTYAIAGAGDGGAWWAKVSENGKLLWHKRWGGGPAGFAVDIRRTQDGGYVAAGRTYSFGDAARGDACVVKLSASGTVSWEKTYGSSESDAATSIEPTPDGGYLVAGEAGVRRGGKLDSDVWIIKLDPGGGIEWERTYDQSPYDGDPALSLTNDGGFVFSAHTGVWQTSVVKAGSRGEIQWQKQLGAPPAGTTPSSIKQTPDGGYVVAGYTTWLGAGNEDVWVVKLDASGNIVWQKTYGGEDYDRAYSVQPTSDNGFVVAGYTGSFGSTSSGGAAWVLKLDGSGNVSWQKAIIPRGARSPYATDSEPMSDGGFILVGSTDEVNNEHGSDLWWVRLDSSGSIVWDRALDLGLDEYGLSMALAHDGGFVLAGRSQVDETDSLNGGVVVIGVDPDGQTCAGVGRSTDSVVEDTTAVPQTAPVNPVNTKARVRRLNVRASLGGDRSSDLCSP
ncbi:MAG: hypothetical protein HYX75_18610 [Acidobacteria bacterium]|nr:hypothetical protein [Acidobacteriota bacterium]